MVPAGCARIRPAASWLVMYAGVEAGQRRVTLHVSRCSTSARPAPSARARRRRWGSRWPRCRPSCRRGAPAARRSAATPRPAAASAAPARQAASSDTAAPMCSTPSRSCSACSSGTGRPRSARAVQAAACSPWADVGGAGQPAAPAAARRCSGPNRQRARRPHYGCRRRPAAPAVGRQPAALQLFHRRGVERRRGLAEQLLAASRMGR